MPFSSIEESTKAYHAALITQYPNPPQLSELAWQNSTPLVLWRVWFWFWKTIAICSDTAPVPSLTTTTRLGWWAYWGHLYIRYQGPRPYDGRRCTSGWGKVKKRCRRIRWRCRRSRTFTVIISTVKDSEDTTITTWQTGIGNIHPHKVGGFELWTREYHQQQHGKN